jgi:thiol-disulfide isomerase/thioredoxin
MKRRTLLLWVLTMSLTITLGAQGRSATADTLQTAPAFTHSNAEDWINSAPLNWNDLHGQVVLLDVWTFDCWNCYHSIPWLKSVESKYHDRGLRIIGVHTPELPQERIKANVVRKVAEFGLHHPVMLDNDFSYWKALGNQYWPAFYLVDKQGRIRRVFVGETHIDDRNARAADSAIGELLGEP